MIDHKKRLEEALRQYRHNNSDEFVAGYDLQMIAKLVDDLVQDNDDPCDATITTTECPLCKGEGKSNVN